MTDVPMTDVLAASAPDCAIAVGPDGRVLDWSPAAEQTFGLGRAEALGQTLEALIGVPPEDTAGQRVEVGARHRQGHAVTCELSVHLLRLPGGVQRLVCLRPSGSCERELQQAGAFAVALSAAMTELAGASAEDELAVVLARCGRPAVPHDATLFLQGGSDLRAHPVRLPGEDTPAVRSAADAPARAAMDRGQVLVLGGAQLPDSAAGWPAGSALVVLPLWVGGRAQGALTLAFEQGPPRGRQLQFLEHLTAQCAHALGNLRAHAALHESEERFRATFNQAAVGIAQTGLDGRWLNVNDKLCEIVGYPRRDLLALTFQDITHPDDLATDLEHVEQLLSGARRTYSLQKRYLRGDGEPVWANLTVSLVRGEDGAPRYFIAVVEDIAAVKATEAELVRARDELEQRVLERTAALQAIGAQLQRQVQELELRNEEARLLGKMGEMLQSCLHIEEARQVVARYAARLFPEASGALYTFGASRAMLEEVESWNGPPARFAVFSPTECWALRRGRLFVREAGVPGPVCGHLPCGHGESTQGDGESTLCAPLLAQGEPVGLLHLCQPQPFTEAQKRLARTVAETTALATVNLRLRETLQQQSIRDPLTGLFNRRHLEETFERESRRARRHGHGIGVVMLDVDHFKRFNDSFGHEAGDALLRELARVLQAGVRGEDVVCRYGGEEFALLLPDASREQTVARAEQLRLSVRDMRVSSRGEALDSVSASFGVATFPEHGEQLYDLLRTADAALYRAKQEGRDRVVVA